LNNDIKFLLDLGFKNPYYNNNNILWFEKNPEYVIIINEKLTIKSLFYNKEIAIFDLWEYFSKGQQKLIINNLDRF
jgi:hypothetical protein